MCLQLTEEKLGTSEKTELDAHFENLSERAECTKVWTEKILRNTESVLTPNPGNRAEDFIFEKIEKKKPTRLSNIEYMGLDMIEVMFRSYRSIVNCFNWFIITGWRWIRSRRSVWKRFAKGWTSRTEDRTVWTWVHYVGWLVLCAATAKILGRRNEDHHPGKGYPWIKKVPFYLELSSFVCLPVWFSCRLDLDACKNRVRKARGMLGQQSVSISVLFISLFKIYIKFVSTMSPSLFDQIFRRIPPKK